MEALAAGVDAAATSSLEDAGIPASVPVDEPEHIDDLATFAAIAAASDCQSVARHRKTAFTVGIPYFLSRY